MQVKIIHPALIGHSNLLKLCNTFRRTGFFIKPKFFGIVIKSLKKMSQLYQVSYPTMRLRLDRLIEKIRLNDNETEDPFILLVKSLAIDDRYDVDTARILIDEYRKRRDES